MDHAFTVNPYDNITYDISDCEETGHSNTCLTNEASAYHLTHLQWEILRPLLMIVSGLSLKVATHED